MRRARAPKPPEPLLQTAEEEADYGKRPVAAPAVTLPEAGPIMGPDPVAPAAAWDPVVEDVVRYLLNEIFSRAPTTPPVHTFELPAPRWLATSRLFGTANVATGGVVNGTPVQLVGADPQRRTVTISAVNADCALYIGPSEAAVLAPNGRAQLGLGAGNPSPLVIATTAEVWALCTAGTSAVVSIVTTAGEPRTEPWQGRLPA